MSLITKKYNYTKKTGRPTKYKPRFVQDFIDYFDTDRTKIIIEKTYQKNGDSREKEIEIANELPTLNGFCNKIGITIPTLHDWVKHKPKFSYAYRLAKQLQEEFWLQNSIRGLYNPAFTIFVGKNMFGWKDRTDITTDDKPLPQPLLSGAIKQDVVVGEVVENTPEIAENSPL